MRRVVIVILAVATILGVACVRAVPAPAATTPIHTTDFLTKRLRQPRGGAASGPVTFHVFDRSGNRVTWAAFRALQENGKGSAGDNDMLLDPATLTVVKAWPLFSSGGTTGDPTFSWPGQPVTLSLAWPTSDGYSNLLLDIDAPGVYNFDLLAADRTVAALDHAVSARPSYRPSPAFSDASAAAHSQLSAAHSSTTEATQGSLATGALDQAVHASTVLLAGYGVQYAAANRATMRPQFGVTFDDISGGAADLGTVRDLVANDSSDGWVRIVFDRSEPASYYRSEVDAAHQLGLHVVGQILDSSDMASQGLTTWQSRVTSYVDTLPTVDEWEVGNEVNGSWLGRDVPAKIDFAARYVKAHTTARTLLTLYWQLGEDDAAHSMFTWLKSSMNPSTMSVIDDLGMSVYPEDHPMGVAFDRAVSTLHAAAPQQRIMLTELGYWSADLGHTWWWGSATDPTGAGRQQVAALYQSAMMGYSYSGGGAYWWYYLTEALPKNQLWSTLAGIHAQVAG
jgi:hypothetical protein